jgi:hypothetical protein
VTICVKKKVADSDCTEHKECDYGLQCSETEHKCTEIPEVCTGE